MQNHPVVDEKFCRSEPTPKLLGHEFLPQIFWKTPTSTRLSINCTIWLKYLRNGKLSIGKVAQSTTSTTEQGAKVLCNCCETRETLANGCIRLAICYKMALQKQRAVLQLNKIEKFAGGKVTPAKKWQMVAKKAPSKYWKQLGSWKAFGNCWKSFAPLLQRWATDGKQTKFADKTCSNLLAINKKRENGGLPIAFSLWDVCELETTSLC